MKCNHNATEPNTLGDWISDGIYRYRRCMVCKKIIVKEEIPEELTFE